MCIVQSISYVYCTEYIICVLYRVYHMCIVQSISYVYCTEYIICVLYRVYHMCIVLRFTNYSFYKDYEMLEVSIKVLEVTKFKFIFSNCIEVNK